MVNSSAGPNDTSIAAATHCQRAIVVSRRAATTSSAHVTPPSTALSTNTERIPVTGSSANQ